MPERVSRRQVLAAAAGAASLSVAGCASQNVFDDAAAAAAPNRTAVNESELPDAARGSVDLARAFARAAKQRVPSVHSTDSNAYVAEDGHIVLQYVTQAESASALEAEFESFADVYADVVEQGDHDPASLYVTTGDVHALVLGPSVEDYVAGDIDKRGYHELIKVTGNVDE